VEAWIEFGRGPLFRLAFSLMVLGLLRIVVLTAMGLVEAYHRNEDKIVNWREVARQTAAWLFPVRRLWRKRPFYSSVSLLFHVGLLLVPIFLGTHVLLWKRGSGFDWATLPEKTANVLTLLVIAAALALSLGRAFDPRARKLSRVQDYVWPLLLAVPFGTGYVCSNAAIPPKSYQALMILHIFSACLIMLLIPFTKIAHCVLAPLSQVVTAIAWKFPAGAGDRVVATLGYVDRPTWLERSRLERPAPADEEVLTL
jgi:nitrate reductase gamma subunit